MRVVMVCTGNTCRSPMAALLLRREKPDWAIESLGLCAFEGERASGEAIQEMARRGLDLAGHRARQATPERLLGALVLCMTGAHVQAVKRLVPAADARRILDFAGLVGDVTDPYGLGIGAYRLTADELARAVKAIADRY